MSRNPNKIKKKLICWSRKKESDSQNLKLDALASEFNDLDDCALDKLNDNEVMIYLSNKKIRRSFVDHSTIIRGSFDDHSWIIRRSFTPGREGKGREGKRKEKRYVEYLYY